MAKQKRIIDQLRKLFPSENWRWDMEMARWVGNSFEVFGESHDYDGSYHTVKYRRTDSYELVHELGSRREYCG
jgi:hypothetical protein